jgi:hypothetical protein
MAELAELGRVAPEEQADGPVRDQPQPPLGARHEREVVGPGEEPRGEAAPLDAERLGHRLMTAHVDEDALGLVTEAPALGAAAHRLEDVVGGDLPLAEPVLGGRRRGVAGSRGIRDGRGVADRPHVGVALDLARRIGREPAAVGERQPRAGRPTGCGLTPAVQQTVRVGMISPSESSIESAEIRSTRVETRTSIPRRRSSAVAYSASGAGISPITRSRASMSRKRIPVTRQRG